MIKPWNTSAALVLLLSSYGAALAADSNSGSSTPVKAASVRFEHNATDEDVEVVFEVIGSDVGLVKLTVVSPDGRTVIDFTAPDTSTLGIRSFQLESPEPKDIASLKAAYPEGIYTFAAITVTGHRLHGESTLSHRLPATVKLLRPGAGATDVGIANLRISWAPVDDIAFYIIEIDQDELGTKLKAQLPHSESAFTVPPDFLQAGREYELSIGSMTDEGNISFVETTFITAE